MNNLYKIGEVAKMFKISISTLRHYENIGILQPEYVDANSGYRYYSIKQFELLNTIKYLRALDMPIDKIADFLANKDTDKLEELLLLQKNIIKAKKEALDAIDKKLDERLKQLKSAMISKKNQVVIKYFPSRTIAYVNERLNPSGYLDLETILRKIDSKNNMPVIFLGKVGLGISKESLINNQYEQYEKVFLLIENDDNYNGKTVIIPEERCATIRFCGTHKDASKFYKDLIEFIYKNEYIISGDSKEITMIDEGITSNKNKFITEIQIPVRRKDDDKI